MGLTDGNASCVILESLVAAKGASLSKRIGPATARDEGDGLIVAKAREDIVRAGEGVIHADIELGFIEAAHWLVDEIESLAGIIGIGQGIQIHQGRAEWVNQRGGYFVAGNAGNLAAIGIDGGWRASGGGALKRARADDRDW